MFLILISCNNSILPGRFYFTDKRLCVSPPASRPHPPQSSRSIPKQGTLSAWTFANSCATLPPSRDAVSFSIHFPIKGSFKSAKCCRSSALDLTPRILPRFRCRFDSDRPVQDSKELTWPTRCPFFPSQCGRGCSGQRISSPRSILKPIAGDRSFVFEADAPL
jgi:hypothetical protein